MALAASSALPPPKPITSSQRSARANVVPRSTVSSSGSPATENVTAPTPLDFNPAKIRSERRESRPVTTRARRPNSLAMAPASLAVPAPKTMRVAVANSNFITMLEFKL